MAFIKEIKNFFKKKKIFFLNTNEGVRPKMPKLFWKKPKEKFTKKKKKKVQ